FAIDATAPVISSRSMSPSTNEDEYSGSFPTISWTASDNYSFSKMQYSINGGSYSTLSTEAVGSAMIEDVEPGVNEISIRAVDAAGNVSSVSTQMYYYDPEAPSATGITLYKDVPNNKVTATVTGITLGDHGLDSVLCMITGDGQTGTYEEVDYNGVYTNTYTKEDETYTVSTLTFDIGADDYDEGFYDVRVKLSDAYSNESDVLLARWCNVDAVYDGSVYMNGSYDDGTYTDDDGNEQQGDETISLSWYPEGEDDIENITSSTLYASYNGGTFEEAGTFTTDSEGSPVTETELTIDAVFNNKIQSEDYVATTLTEDDDDQTVDDFMGSVSFRTVVTLGEEKYLSDVVTIDKYMEVTKETTTDEDTGEETVSITSKPLYMTSSLDSDGDGLEDFYEIWDIGTNPELEDSDMDGFPDFYETGVYGTNPSLYTVTADSDADGLTDMQEYEAGTNPWLVDSDFDGYSDSLDTQPLLTDASNVSNAVYSVSIHQGIYDRTETHTEDNVTTTVVYGIYDGLTKTIYDTQADSTKYFYDNKGNNTVIISYVDGEYYVNTFSYDEDGVMTSVYRNGFRYDFETGTETVDETEYDYSRVAVDDQTIVKNTTTTVTDNTENEDTLGVGETLMVTRDNSAYGNGQNVTVITTRYKDGEDETALDVVAKDEIYYDYGNQTTPDFVIEYDAEGNVIYLEDNTTTTQISYDYTYTDTDNGRIESFTKSKNSNEKYTKTREYTYDNDEDKDGITQDTIVDTYEYTVYNGATSVFTDVSKSFETTCYSKQTDDAAYSKTTTELVNGGLCEKSVVNGDGIDIDGNISESEDLNMSRQVIYNGTGDDAEDIITTITEYGEDETTITYSDGTEIVYRYDTYGNITHIEIDGVDTYHYEYDRMEQLTKEWIYYEQTIYLVYEYEYDNAGNVICVTEYESEDGTTPNEYGTYETEYEYATTGIKDQLVSIDGGAIEYDEAGNPTSYQGLDLEWCRGRCLSSADNISFEYNQNNLRTKKETIEYEYDGNNLVREWNAHTGRTIEYIYEGDGEIVGFTICDDDETSYNGTYYYKKNLQRDVIAIYDDEGNEVVRYLYDAWGKLLDYNGNGWIAEANPIRYRSYYYDEETCWYYLQSRYYDPEVGRWISPEPNVDYGEFDEGAGLLGYNVYAYCDNNPVIFKDETGESITLTCVLIGAGIGLLVGGGFGAYRASKKGYSPGDGWKYWKYVVGYGVAGGAIGALVGWGAGALIAKYGVATAATSITKGGGARFSSFNALKRSLGSAGEGKQWHHIVEQCQIGKSGFSKYWIQNSNNVINISNSVHTKISAYYSSIQSFTNGMTFRNWLAGQSFKTQYEWGIKVLRMFGVKI
ncbi:MAG: RHS repeat domain-containing protein, partial [Eubacterium sp.]